MRKLAALCREDLGDARAGVQGEGCRPAGRFENAKALTTLNPNDPLVNAAYD